MNAFTKRKIEEGRALYIAMCKGKVAQRSIHRNRKNKGVVIGQGFSYHGHININ